MKLNFIFTCTLLLISLPNVAAQPKQSISESGSRPSIAGPEQFFTGAARIDHCFLRPMKSMHLQPMSPLSLVPAQPGISIPKANKLL